MFLYNFTAIAEIFRNFSRNVRVYDFGVIFKSFISSSPVYIMQCDIFKAFRHTFSFHRTQC
jgi:hypothetical protein